MRRQIPEDELAALKDKAAAMRAAGIGAARIARELGVGHTRCRELLRDVPKPASLARPEAKDEHRAAAIALRREGRTYDEISAELGVSKGSLSLWLREIPRGLAGPDDIDVSDPTAACDIARTLRVEGWLLREIAQELGVSVKTAHTWTRGLPIPPRATHGRSPEETSTMNRVRWDRILAERQVERTTVHEAAADRIGDLTDREVELVAVTAYWCEGAKSKPWRRQERLIFINSDEGLVRVWLQFVRARGVDDSRLRLTVNIHESADVQRATAYWAAVVGCPVESFTRPVLKRHAPKTTRRNVGETYVGCLTVGVRGSRRLYQEVEGVWRAICSAFPDQVGRPDTA